MPRFVADSWAWVEYLRGSKLWEGLRIRIDSRAEIFTHVVTLAELASKFRREGLDVEAAWQAVRSLSKIFIIDESDAKSAGVLHATIKESRPNFSLADAFALQAARKLNCRILTGDPDFRAMKDAIMLDKDT